MIASDHNIMFFKSGELDEVPKLIPKFEFIQADIVRLSLEGYRFFKVGFQSSLSPIDEAYSYINDFNCADNFWDDFTDLDLSENENTEWWEP